MDVQHVYMVMFGGMPSRPTGLAMSVLRRAWAFRDAGIRTTILIDSFYPDYDLHNAELEASKRIGDRISVRYMYHDLAGVEAYPEHVSYSSPLGVEGWEYAPLKNKEGVLLGRYQGVYAQRVLLRDGRVLFIDHMNDGVFDKRVWYDIAGSACKVENMGPSEKPISIQYLDRRGDCYLEESRDEMSQQVLGCEVYPRSVNSRQFANMVGVFAFWMQTLVLVGEFRPIIISEYGARRTALDTLSAELDARVIYTLHNNHLAAPHRYGSAIRREMQDLLTRRSSANPLVVLTGEQRLDLWKQYGWDESIHVIPHYIYGVELNRTRDPKKVVMVGRFHEIKGQLAAIRAFRRVVDTVPDAKLVFYGRGGEESAMLRSIEEHGLTKNVSIAGFTSNADEVFAGSAVSIVGSDYEGFCLSLAESMAQGCIPVSYDIKYGPAQLIDNGVNGLLVDYANEIELADAIILCLSDPVRRQAMSIAAGRIRETLSKDKFIGEWRAVFEALSCTTGTSPRVASGV